MMRTPSREPIAGNFEQSSDLIGKALALSLDIGNRNIIDSGATPPEAFQ
jgi:hypothetical protein